jgi:hypothetical protein
MSLPANITYTLNGTTYVEEPKLPQLVAATIALCANAGHPEYLPTTVTQKIETTTYVNTPMLADLVAALRKLGANVPSAWSIEEVLAAIRSLNG